MNQANNKKASEILDQLMNQRFFPQYGGRYGAAYGMKKMHQVVAKDMTEHEIPVK